MAIDDGLPEAVTVLQGAQGNLGNAFLGLGDMSSGPPPEVFIHISGQAGQTEEVYYELRLGDVFAVGALLWRFADVSFTGPHSGRAVFTRVDPGDRTPWQPPPLTGNRTWNPAPLETREPASPDQLAEAERLLGRPFPQMYRRWLGQTNGATPVEELTIPGLPFALFRQRPLLGVGFPEEDILLAETRQRQRLLPPKHIVIGRPSGGLLTVMSNPPDMVGFLAETAMVGMDDPASCGVRDGQVVWVAPSIYQFVDRLKPFEPLDSPATPEFPPQGSAPQR